MNRTTHTENDLQKLNELLLHCTIQKQQQQQEEIQHSQIDFILYVMILFFYSFSFILEKCNLAERIRLSSAGAAVKQKLFGVQ